MFPNKAIILALLAFLSLPVNGQKKSGGATNTDPEKPCGQGTVWHGDACIVDPCEAGKTVWSESDSECVHVNVEEGDVFTGEKKDDDGLGGGWIFLIVVSCLWVCFVSFVCFLYIEGSEELGFEETLMFTCGPCGFVLGFALFVALLPITAPFAAWFAKPRHVTPMIVGSMFVK